MSDERLTDEQEARLRRGAPIPEEMLPSVRRLMEVGQMAKPLTDAALVAISGWAEDWHRGREVEPALLVNGIAQLIAEVCRLRVLILHRLHRDWEHGRGCTPCDEFQKMDDSPGRPRVAQNRE